MRTAALVTTPDGEDGEAELTTDHPASSDGLPVVALTVDGLALAPADLEARFPANMVELAEGEPVRDIFRAGLRAGYRIAWSSAGSASASAAT